MELATEFFTWSDEQAASAKQRATSEMALIFIA